MSLSLQPPIPAATNGASAWTTVGPSGRISAAAATSARSSSTLVQSPSGSTNVGRTNGIVPPRPPAVKAASPNTPKVDDFPAPPSHDFLKWLSDSLKGLNSSVNGEKSIFDKRVYTRLMC
jgi:PERQ amino acid-rich with GYF domain-containing protein